MLNYVLTHKNAKVPTRSRESSACYDLYTPERVIILSNEIKMINTHFKCELDEHTFAVILGKSKLATKGLVILGGVIDHDYRGEWIICCSNLSLTYIAFNPGDAVAQFAILPMMHFAFHLVEKLSDTQRGQTGILDAITIDDIFKPPDD